MNCQLFENSINDLARAQMMDAATRESALAHAAACARCATRLASERAATAGLRAVAGIDAEAKASPRVEAALLTAFRERNAKPLDVETDATTPAHADVPVSVLSFANAEKERNRISSRRSGWVLKAAAAIVLMFAAGLTASLMWRDAPRSQGASESLRGSDASASATTNQTGDDEFASIPKANSEASSGSKLTPEAVAALNRATDETAEDAPEVVRSGSAATTRQPSRARATQFGARYQEAGMSAGRSARAANAARASASSGEESAEITTDFFPMGGAGALTAMEGGQVVRVELPRAALASYGLMMNSERGSGRVKADVLIGDDGIARAIRFVR